MTPIQQAVKHMGGPSKLAAHLGVTPQAVCFWRDGDRRLPVEHCAVIEQVTGGAVTRKDLRPNDWASIWPELAEISEQKQAPALAHQFFDATQKES